MNSPRVFGVVLASILIRPILFGSFFDSGGFVFPTLAANQAWGGRGQATLSDSLPGVIVTRYTVFVIPFRILPAQDSSQQAVEVQLYVSIDQGRHWQLYQRVRPTEGRFLIRTTGEGEYWFLVRTMDRAGRIRPQLPPRPEMRVIVDTTPPRLLLMAEVTPSGGVRIRWKMTDRTLRPETLQISYRMVPEGPWQPVPRDSAQVHPIPDGQEGQLMWIPLGPGGRAELRAEVVDEAGNRAVAHAQVQMPGGPTVASLNPPGNLLQDQWRAIPAEERSQPLVPDPVHKPRWSPSEPQADGPRPSASEKSVSTPAGEDSDSLATAPPITTPLQPPVREQFSLGHQRQPLAAQEGLSRSQTAGAMDSSPSTLSQSDLQNTKGIASGSGEGSSGSVFSSASLAPNRSGLPPQQSSGTNSSSGASEADSGSLAQQSNLTSSSGLASEPAGSSGPGSAPSAAHCQQPPGGSEEPLRKIPVRMVNSRVFELEYELNSDTVPGRVELWATRDGGQTWRSWGPDTDNRSPMIVSVPEEGMYGFRILVSADSRMPTSGPAPGEKPDVWIKVDWTPPTGRIVAVQPAQTSQGSQLVIRWEAADRNLAERPISLFFSPTGIGGSWSPIATELENTGEYCWKVPSTVNDRMYIRLEIRDQAGNLTVDQTQQALQIGQPIERAKIRQIRPVHPRAKTVLPGRLS